MENQEIRKSSYWKFIGAFIGIILMVVIGFIAWKAYEISRDRNAVKSAAEAMERAGEWAYARAMADTYGGKTPQETLAMYIDAVEKGDYELASKYFIGDNQVKELESFNQAAKAPKEKIDMYISTLNDVLKRSGKYSSDNQYFSFDGDILVRMKAYPNGIWKIIEI